MKHVDSETAPHLPGLGTLSREQRMMLMRFVCSMAWSDLDVQDEERVFIGRMIDRLGFSPEEVAQIESWIEVPPPAEEVDPSAIPREHRELFLQTIRQLAQADGSVDREEHTSLALLEELFTDRAS